MRKDIRYTICLVAIILLALLCIYRILADREIEENGNNDQIEVTNPSPTERTIIVTNGNDNLVLETVCFYKVKLSGMILESVEVAVGKGIEVSPKLITEYVTDALEDEEIDLEILDIIKENGICTLNLGREMGDIARSNPSLEKLILDAYSMSIVDNCTDINGVSFRINSKPYETQNIKLKDGEVYLKN